MNQGAGRANGKSRARNYFAENRGELSHANNSRHYKDISCAFHSRARLSFVIYAGGRASLIKRRKIIIQLWSQVRIEPILFIWHVTSAEGRSYVRLKLN